VLSIVLVVVLVLSLGSRSTQSLKSAHDEDLLALTESPRPARPAGDPTAATTAPLASIDPPRPPAAPLAGIDPPSAPAAPPAAAETSVSTPVVPGPAGTPLTTAEIVARCDRSVALIKGKVSSGTGFLVRHGIVATNAHVIEEEFLSNLEVRFPSAPSGNQGPLAAQLLYEDRKRDLAFLAVKSDLPALLVAPKYAFLKGEDITVIGNPGLGDEVVLENAISRGVMSSKTVIDGMNYHQMNIAINPGNSGGPVFDSVGRVIGVATLKSTKAEAMGFCIPVEDVNAALSKVGPARVEVASRHRALLAFKTLTIAGAVYAVALDVRAGILRSAPAGGSNANLLPNEDVQKLHQVVTSLDEKVFSLVDNELPRLKNDPALAQTSQRGYQDLSANYKAMKNLYANPNRLADQYAAQIQNLKAQHLRLVQSLRKDLRIEVPPQLLAVLERGSPVGQPPGMVAEFVPFQIRPRMLHGRLGPGLDGPIGPRMPGIPDPMQQARERMKAARDRMQDMRNRARGLRSRIGP